MTPAIAYCDYNATAPIRPEAADAVARALAQGGNPSSVHRAGRAAKAVLESAREQVARSVGARARDAVFTSGATEALHMALDAARGAYGDLIVSEIEHDAVWDAAKPVRTIACGTNAHRSVRPCGLLHIPPVFSAVLWSCRMHGNPL